MKLNWKYFNFTILCFQILVCLVGTFYKHIAFGLGLGDMLYYGILYFSTIGHIVATIKTKNIKDINHFKSLAIIFLVIITLICLKATIWRGTEYAWNGELFYSN